MDLPEFLSPPPEKEALELALDSLVFGPLAEDEAALKASANPSSPPLKAYLLLDAAINPDIHVCAEAFAEPSRCLFDGPSFEELADVGPWLIELRRYGDAWDWYVADGYGHNWGIIIHSRLPLMRLKTQMKKFIKIKDEEEMSYFFKFYRPEHLNAYLPTFDDQQRTSFMRGLDAIMAETHRNANHLQHHSLSAQGALESRSIDLVETGMPLRILPPSDDEVDVILSKAAGESGT